MDKLLSPARIFYASYGILFGLQNLIYGTFMATLVPAPKWMIANAPITYLVGVVVLLISVAVTANFKGQFFSTLLAIFYFLLLLVLHLQKLVTDIYNPQEWTVAAEIIALSAGGFILATLLPTDIWEWYGLEKRKLRIRRVAILIFAMTLLVFAFLHFKYAEFISFLIPAWIPGRLFFSYLVGAGFLAAAIALGIKIMDRVAATLLSAMFFTWVLIEHLPRVVQHSENRDEWSSAGIALAMSGISFLMAVTLSKKPITEAL